MINKITAETRLVVLTSGDQCQAVSYHIRLKLGCVEWPAAGRFQHSVVLINVSENQERDLENRLREVFDSKTGALVAVDATIKRLRPELWRFADRARSEQISGNVIQSIFLCNPNRGSLRECINNRIIDLNFSASARLRELVDNVWPGKGSFDSWLNPFKTFEVPHFAEWIISSMNLVDRGQMSRAMGIDDASRLSTCVLTGTGSDKLITRELERRAGWPCVPTLNQMLQRRPSETITVIVDAIHGGGQLLSNIRNNRDAIARAGCKIKVIPCHATQHGIDTVETEMPESIRAHIEIDASNAIMVRNAVSGSSVPRPEIELRLNALGCRDSLIAQILDFSKCIGQQLCPVDGSTCTGVKGLGRRNLGLTTLLDGAPSQAALPLLWVSSGIGRKVTWKTPTGRLAQSEWAALVPHQHDQSDEIC